MKSKLAEDILFPRGLSAELDNLWDPADIMRKCAKWRGMIDEECYETWNGESILKRVGIVTESGEKVFVASEYIEAKISA
jgi:hypothetical protein